MLGSLCNEFSSASEAPKEPLPKTLLQIFFCGQTPFDKGSTGQKNPARALDALLWKRP